MVLQPIQQLQGDQSLADQLLLVVLHPSDESAQSLDAFAASIEYALEVLWQTKGLGCLLEEERSRESWFVGWLGLALKLCS